MTKETLKTILEYEQTEESDLRLEQIYKFLLTGIENEKIGIDRDDSSKSRHK